MTASATVMVLIAALCIDAAFGYPDQVFRRIGHPVSWIGSLIGVLEARMNDPGQSAAARQASGVVVLLILIGVAAGMAFVIESLLAPTLLGKFVLAILASTLISGRSLFDHVRDVATALDRTGLDGARVAVGRIVGRNPQVLDESGVARAAIESLAENASDGVVAPAIWFLLLGLPGLAAYKAINTADSMIGHRTPRHEAFGWAAARLDDLVNLPASRITGGLFAAAAMLLPGASPADALGAMRRDAAKHRSPNAGWPESAMAGALGLKLNGPKTYGAVVVEDAYMGDGRREATAADIRNALALACRAWLILVLALVVTWLTLRG